MASCARENGTSSSLCISGTRSQESGPPVDGLHINQAGHLHDHSEGSKSDGIDCLCSRDSPSSSAPATITTLSKYYLVLAT